MKRVFIISVLLIGTSISSFAQYEHYYGLFIYNFSKYFDWPAETKNSDFIIQVLDQDAVYNKLTEIVKGKTVGSQRIVVKSISSYEEIDSKAQILFVSNRQSRHFSKIIEKLNNKPVLLITESNDFIEKGAMISFVKVNEAIRFEFCPSRATNAGLVTDGRLKQLAYKVIN